MDQTEKVTLRLLRQNHRVDVVLSDRTLDIIQKLADQQGTDAEPYLREVVVDHTCQNASKVLPPPPMPAWMLR